MAELDIRPVTAQTELAEVQALQAAVWSAADVVPRHHLVAAARNGGILLGAWLESVLAGFVYGFAGCEGGQAYLYSHMLGVRPGYRHHGVGRRLKLAQREWALDQRYTLIRWSYDPLESANANLNIRRLGAVGRRYIADYDGTEGNSPASDLPADRLIADWSIGSARVHERLSVGPPALDAARDLRDVPLVGELAYRGGFAVLSAARLDLDAPRLLLPIPQDLQTLKQQDPEAALRWRLYSRNALAHYLRRGYSVLEFVSGPEQGVNFYLLEQEEPR